MTKILSERSQWKSSKQFLLTCIGFAVGLGNIWRFPGLAYENGGSAFLIPYLTFSFLIGFPLLYLELSLGQFAKAGPAVVHGRIRPLFHGIGWAMATISLLVAIYYNVIVAWVLVYIYEIFKTLATGSYYRWSLCNNYFNTDACTRHVSMQNGTSPFEEFFEYVYLFFHNFFSHYILEKSSNMQEFGGFNYKILIALSLAWILTALVLIKGVKVIGRVALFTATAPYIIILILFIRSVTLDGAGDGVRYYLLEPDIGKLLQSNTWRKAAEQLCYSLGIGFGGLLSLSSFNPSDHNCFRDALIITCSDGFMSIFGGTAVFSVLGYMSKKLNKSIGEVVKSGNRFLKCPSFLGTSLAFIVYPQAMHTMSISWLWSLLFFFMLFTLGISSQFGLTEVGCTAFYDQFPSTRKYKAYTVVGMCAFLFSCGLVMTTKAGIYYFTIFNEFSASFTLLFLLSSEIFLIMYIYGCGNYIADLRTIFGQPRSKIGKIFGPTGVYIRISWLIIAPCVVLWLFIVALTNQLSSTPKYENTELSTIGKILAWVLSILPLIIFAIFIFYNCYKFKSRKQSLVELFLLQPKWPSYISHLSNTEKQRQFWKNIEQHLWEQDKIKIGEKIEKSHSSQNIVYRSKRRRSSVALYPTKEEPLKVGWVFFDEFQLLSLYNPDLNDDFLKNGTLV